MIYHADEIREELSAKHIRGSGIEIGALCHPLKVGGSNWLGEPTTHVVYVDRFDTRGLHEQYPEIPEDIMCPVSHIDDGEKLSHFVDASKDFIIANHFLEHCKNPIGTLESWLRVLKSGGIIYCAVPERTECFDENRPNTEWKHVLKEYYSGEYNINQHYEENGRDPKSDYSIHFHCWDREVLDEFFLYVEKILPLNRVEFIYNPLRQENIFIGRKA